jgi:hypothetical protein
MFQESLPRELRPNLVVLPELFEKLRKNCKATYFHSHQEKKIYFKRSGHISAFIPFFLNGIFISKKLVIFSYEKLGGVRLCKKSDSNLKSFRHKMPELVCIQFQAIHMLRKSTFRVISI